MEKNSKQGEGPAQRFFRTLFTNARHPGVFSPLRRSNAELLAYLGNPGSRPEIERSADAASFRQQERRAAPEALEGREPVVPVSRGPRTTRSAAPDAEPPPFPGMTRSQPRAEQEIYWEAPSNPLDMPQAPDTEPWRQPEEHFIGSRVTPLKAGSPAPGGGLEPADGMSAPPDFWSDWMEARDRALGPSTPERERLRAYLAEPESDSEFMRAQERRRFLRREAHLPRRR